MQPYLSVGHRKIISYFMLTIQQKPKNQSI
jgi:hypothetical protein